MRIHEVNTDEVGQNDISEGHNEIKTYRTAKSKIEKSVFLGKYKERRYVDALGNYRDVIVVDNHEEEFIMHLNRILSNSNGKLNKWVGITIESDDNCVNYYCLWVQLNNVPFGQHWFQVKSINNEPQEKALKLKHLRPYQPSTFTNSSKGTEGLDVSEFQLDNILTFHNFCEATKFTSLAILALITSLVHVMRHLGNFTVNFMYAFNNLISVLTPILLGIMEFFSKCVGGLYLLVYMLIKGNSGPPAGLNPLQMTSQISNYKNRALAYNNTPDARPQMRYPYTDEQFRYKNARSKPRGTRHSDIY